MNKDVYYIEPEDDITDIVNRVKSSEKKIVALVPPKKMGVLRSKINLKLLYKAAKTADKAVVIITTDQALTKLSGVSGLPVAKALNSRPLMPSEIVEEEAADPKDFELEETEPHFTEKSDNDDSDDENAEASSKNSAKMSKKSTKSNNKDEIDLNSEQLKDDSEESDEKVKKLPSLERYRKWIILGVVGVVALIAFLVWANIFAPFAKITVAVKTTSDSFSENVSFVTKEDQADVASGKLYLEQVSYTDESSTEFEATGEKNEGEKAEGTVYISATTNALDYYAGKTTSVTIPSGTAATSSNKNFFTTADLTLDFSSCDWVSGGGYCTQSAAVKVRAKEPGTSYNIAAGSWQIAGGYTGKSNESTSGGTDKIVKIVTKDDIKKATENLTSNSTESKQKLLAQINTEEMVAIEASYKIDAEDPVSSPKEGEAIEDGKKAKLTAKTTHKIYVVDRTKIDEFIKAKYSAKLTNDQILHSTGSPFFERYLETDKEITAKLKTTVKTGPDVTEAIVLEKSKGKKIGEVQSLIKSINGVQDVTIEKSVPWMSSVPSDENKIEIKISVDE